MKFSSGLPGLMRYPPSQYPLEEGGGWQSRLRTEDVQRLARTAERLGFDAISVPEHLVMPLDLAGSMGAFWPDAFTVMAFVAGATERIRVNSSVIILPLHQPVAFAKAVSTLDVLSGGRVTVTFGVGMARGEFAALGVAFTERGRIADEYIHAMKELWTADAPEFHGAYVDFAGVQFEPKPVQRPHPPVWIGGSSMAALRRAARVGDGWHPAGSQGGKGPWVDSVADLPVFLAEARKVPGFAAREATFDISMPATVARFGPNHEALTSVEAPVTSAADVIDRIAELQRAGVTWTTIPRPGAPSPRSLDEYLENLEWAGTEVMPAFRGQAMSEATRR